MNKDIYIYIMYMLYIQYDEVGVGCVAESLSESVCWSLRSSGELRCLTVSGKKAKHVSLRMRTAAGVRVLSFVALTVCAILCTMSPLL